MTHCESSSGGLRETASLGFRKPNDGGVELQHRPLTEGRHGHVHREGLLAMRGASFAVGAERASTMTPSPLPQSDGSACDVERHALASRYGDEMVYEKTDGRAEAGWHRQHVTNWDGSPADAPLGYRIVTVDTASGAELRDLASFRRDLELAMVYADAFTTHVADGKLQGSRDPFLGLWNAAVVAYGRAFNSGVRHAARVATNKLDEDEAKAHEYFLNLRNKHVAHAVNGYEDTIVIAYLTNSAFMPRAVTRTGQVHTDLVFNPTTAPLELSALCAKLIDELNNRIKKLHFQIGRELSEMGLDRVYSLPDITNPTPVEVGRSRRRK